MKLYKDYAIELDGSKYSLYLGRGIIYDLILETLNTKTNNKDVIIVFDSIFDEKIQHLNSLLKQNGYNVYKYSMVAGKHNKTFSEAMKIYEVLESNELARDSTMIALGGGVIGDLAGFVASTYYRGMNLIHVPTTMTAMIDSSIGGKVAINFRKTINAIGNYYHPILNVVDCDFLDTLPMRDYIAGLAEIIKCAVIADEKLFRFLEENSDSILNQDDEEKILYIMSRTIEIKLDHVTKDVKEQGKRLKLNYGHTLGHSIEVATFVLEELYRHGEGVSLGMTGAAYIAEKYFKTDGEILSRHENILRKYNLPVRVNIKDTNFEYDTLLNDCMSIVNKDKKRKNNKLRFVLCEEIGKCGVYNDISESLTRDAFKYLIGAQNETKK